MQVKEVQPAERVAALFSNIVAAVRSQYPEKEFIPLHEPKFRGNDRAYVMEAIDSTYVSSVGPFVDKFEQMMAALAGTKYAVATVNGTAALHMALLLAGVKRDEEVLMQDLTFIATANAISYIGAQPVFVDIEQNSLGLCPEALSRFLNEYGVRRGNQTFNKQTGRKIAACVPMHTFGFPSRIDEIAVLCDEWHIPLIEDAAESLGSFYKDKSTGSYGLMGTFSFNGNKTVTCGGGGAIVTNDAELARKAKYLTTQAKVPHAWEFFHDETGYNYRLPNLNAALACAQLEQLEGFIADKRATAAFYESAFRELPVKFQTEPEGSRANFWLNAIRFADRDERDAFLEYSNKNGVMTRPSWTLMHKLPMFKDCICGPVHNAQMVEDTLVNIPSSVKG